MNTTVQFQKINQAGLTTGLSQTFLRNGCRNGTLPCIKSGKVYYIDVFALRTMLSGKERDAQ
jgi:hypothetical protein